MTDVPGVFHSGNRHEWCDMVRPPEGYRLAAAIGTTYNLEPVALTALLMALVDGDPDQRSDPADMLRAITQLSDRVRVFLHRGRLGVDAEDKGGVHPIVGLLDRMIREMRPEVASFHPKVWVFQYDPIEQLGPKGLGKDARRPSIVRWMCGSRNLSPSPAWELTVGLDGVVDQGRVPEPAEGDLGSFVEALLAEDPTAPQALRGLPNALRQAHYRYGDTLRKAEFHWQGTGSRRLSDLLGSGEAALVVSPFLTPDFLVLLKRKFPQVHVLSRQEALDKCPDRVIGGNLSAWVLNEGDDEAPMGLHAKLLVCKRSERKVEAFLGSANATSPGWALSHRANWEAVVQFPMAAPFEEILKDFGCCTSDGVGWVAPYLRGPAPDPDEVALAAADELLDHVSEAMGALTLLARYDATQRRLSLGTATSDRLAVLAEQFAVWGTVEVRPLGCSAAAFVPLGPLGSGCVFDPVELYQASEFLLVRAHHRATGRSKSFAIKVVLEVPDDFWDLRRTDALRTFLTRERFLAYLQTILLDRFARPSRGGEAPPKPDPKRAGPSAPHVFDVLAAEQVMQGCLDDPARFAEVRDLVASFESTGHIDPQFLKFWNAFAAAWKREVAHA